MEMICDPTGKPMERSLNETEIRCTLCKHFDPNTVSEFSL